MAGFLSQPTSGWHAFPMPDKGGLGVFTASRRTVIANQPHAPANMLPLAVSTTSPTSPVLSERHFM
jgi:non-ribosomal peptide synthetase component E (peptide arylation enzyme)